MSTAAIAPLGECRSNVELFRALAGKMGFGEECFQESVDQMIDAALDSENPRLRGIDRGRLQREGQVRLNFENQVPDSSSQFPDFLPFAEGNFGTRSGKAELYSGELKAQGMDPVAEFVPPVESRHGSQARDFPLELLARKADNFLNTTFCNLPVVQEMEEVGLLEMNAADASSRKIVDGDVVRVFNRRGEVLLRARVDGAVQAGVVSAKLHWAKLSSGSRNINVLTSEKLTDLGNSATFYSVLVEVESVKSSLTHSRGLDGLHSSTV
jgi:anaerobic selenocysteine-containing dehydrogenase